MDDETFQQAVRDDSPQFAKWLVYRATVELKCGCVSTSRFTFTLFRYREDPNDQLDYPILSDPSKTFATQLGCLNDRGMSNRWTYYIGKDNKILFIDKNVKADDHATAIAKKLDELGVEKK